MATRRNSTATTTRPAIRRWASGALRSRRTRWRSIRRRSTARSRSSSATRSAQSASSRSAAKRALSPIASATSCATPSTTAGSAVTAGQARPGVPRLGVAPRPCPTSCGRAWRRSDGRRRRAGDHAGADISICWRASSSASAGDGCAVMGPSATGVTASSPRTLRGVGTASALRRRDVGGTGPRAGGRTDPRRRGHRSGRGGAGFTGPAGWSRPGADRTPDAQPVPGSPRGTDRRLGLPRTSRAAPRGPCDSGYDPRGDLPAKRAVQWLRVLADTWVNADVPEARADLLHAIYDRIVVKGRSIVAARLTPAAYSNGLALALPQVVMARPEGFEPPAY